MKQEKKIYTTFKKRSTVAKAFHTNQVLEVVLLVAKGLFTIPEDFDELDIVSDFEGDIL